VPALDERRASVQVELPDSWRPVPVAPDGDRAGQRRVLAGWAPGTDTRAVEDRLVRQSRRAARAGVRFAAVLLAQVDGPRPDDQPLVLTGSLRVGFRRVGDPDPRVAAEGVLASLRQQARATRRLSLVGLGRDPDRPAVLVQEQGPVDGTVLARADVLWLLPGSGQLVSVSTTTADLPLAAAHRDVALSVAASLQVAAG
jgi:hypothetical protein